MKEFTAYAEFLRNTIECNESMDADDVKAFERQIKACEIADDEDGLAYELCDIGAYNDVIRGYILLALEGHEDIRDEVIANMRYIFDAWNARSAENYYKKYAKGNL